MKAVWLFLIVVFSPLSSSAQSSDKVQTFTVGNENVSFTWFESRGITITSKCVEAGKLRNCDAKKALERVNLSKLEKDSLGRNPGALLCSAQLGGTVVWAKDAKENERTFCKFRDSSMVGSGTLAHYGRVNSKRP